MFYIIEFAGKLCEQQRKYFVNLTAMVLSGILPAFAIFGFYRLWIGIIERWPTTFYEYSCNLHLRYKPHYGAKHKPEPGLEELGIIPSNEYTYGKNVIVGIGYIFVAFSGAILPWFTVLTVAIILLLIFFRLFNNELTNIILIIVAILILFSFSIYLLVAEIFNKYIVLT